MAFDSWWANTGLNPSNWFGSGATTAGEPTSVDWSGMQGSGNITSSTTPGDIGSGASGVDWSKVASSLGNLSKDSSGTGTSSGSGSDSGSSSGGSNLSYAPSGRPAHAVDINSLVQMLEQKRNQYMPGTANTQAVKPTQYQGGLLGY